MEATSHSTRRQFLKTSGLVGTASLLAGSQSLKADQPLKSSSSGHAKNMIFLVVDGLCNGTLGLAHHWSLRNRNEPLNWMKLFEHPDLHRAFQDTASANSPVTDSAAAASAWGCGQRVNNGSINTSVSGEALKPLLSYAKEAGKATGLVSTCEITHATPAGFAASVPQRNMAHEIAQQYLERKVDVLLGGGSKRILQKHGDGSVVDLFAHFEEAGYQVARSRSELLATNRSERLLGIFAEGHIPYAIDRQNDRAHAEVPSLPEMFKVALDRLKDAPEGFVLQVEGGRVDHAGHANDPGAILHELLEFDACIPIALEYLKNDPDTLLIVTTDHGTGGCQLDGQGEAYRDSGPALERINQLKYSFEWVQSRSLATGTFNPILFSMATGLVPTDDQIAQVQNALDEGVTYLSGALNEAFGEQLKEITAVGWSSGKHTAECVDVLSFGPHADQVPAFLKNYELFGVMTKALGFTV